MYIHCGLTDYGNPCCFYLIAKKKKKEFKNVVLLALMQHVMWKSN